MKYTAPSFTVPASAGNANICAAVQQHCGPDLKGRCLRCGVKYEPSREEVHEWFVQRWVEGMPHG